MIWLWPFHQEASTFKGAFAARQDRAHWEVFAAEWSPCCSKPFAAVLPVNGLVKVLVLVFLFFFAGGWVLEESCARCCKVVVFKC